MEERKNAEQAYKDALTKMSMPAIFDADKEMFSNGRSGIKMKSKVLAYAAAAAVLAVCIGIGAIMINARSGDVRTSPGVDSGLHLEEDQTIPSGEIKSIEQAVEEHQKCMLLENDEYIKLKANRDNITKDTANSFIDRKTEIEARDKECLDYIDKNVDSKQIMFVHAVMYDNGETSVSYRIGSDLDDETYKALDKENDFWLCDANTGDKIYKCVSIFTEKPTEQAGIAEKIDTSEFSKLSGEISLVSQNQKNSANSVTLIKGFKFFDKLFINTSMRAELAKLALKASDKQDNSKYENAVNISADKVVCSQHGMYMRLTVTAANDTGKSIIKKSLTSEHGENTVRLSGGDQADAPQPDVNLGKSVTGVGWYTTLVESTENKLVYDCYLPMTRSVDMDLNFVVYAVMHDPTLTADEIADGIGRNKKLGSLKVRYEDPMKERTFFCGGKKIMLSDLCLGISDTADKVTEITFKKDDGTQEKLTEKDFAHCSIVEYGDEDEPDVWYKCFTQIAAPEDFRANFITKSVDTSHVTSIVYAGEEYTLTKTPEYKTAEQAQKAFEQAYNAQLDILAKYSKQIAQLTEPDGRKAVCRQLCEQYDGYEETIKNAGRQLAKLNGGKCLHAGRTTAGEIVFYMWYDESFPAGFTVAKECLISTDKEAKNVILTGRTMYEFMASPQIQRERNNYITLISDNSGSDLTKLKTGQTYYITFNDENHKTNGKHITKEFTLTSDTPEMSMNDRFVTILPQMNQYAYA